MAMPAALRALILAAGEGKRLRSPGTPKGLVQVGGKALIEYSLQGAWVAGVDEIIVVIGPRSEAIRTRYGTYFGPIPLRYAWQENATGIVDAIMIGSKQLDQADFILLLADEILVDPNYVGMCRRFMAGEVSVLCGVMRNATVNQIKKNYEVAMSSTSKILWLKEKPDNPVGDVVGLGTCIFQNRMLNYVETTPLNPRQNQKELADLIQVAIDSGESVEGFPLCTRYVNVNTPTDIIEADQELKSSRKSD